MGENPRKRETMSANDKLKMLVRTLLHSAVFAVFTARALNASAGSETADDYLIQGTIEARLIRYSNTQRSYYYDTTRDGFEAYVSGCRWLIRMGTHDPNVFDYRVVSSDGENTYLLLNYETRLKNRKAKGETPGPNLGDGTVVKGSMPCFGIAEEAGAIWLAYASACWFEKSPDAGGSAVPFVKYVRDSSIMPGEGLASQPSFYALDPSFPRLPISIAYYVQGSRNVQLTPQASSGEKRAFTNVTYQALSFTNAGGISFPMAAVATTYRLNPQARDEVQVCDEFRLYTTNIVVGVVLSDFRPKLPGCTVVSEQRFNNGTALSFAYFRTNSWPDDAEVQRSRAYKAALADHRQTKAGDVASSGGRGFRRVLIGLVLIGSAIGFPAAVWFIKRRNLRLPEKNRQTNERKEQP